MQQLRTNKFTCNGALLSKSRLKGDDGSIIIDTLRYLLCSQKINLFYRNYMNRELRIFNKIKGEQKSGYSCLMERHFTINLNRISSVSLNEIFTLSWLLLE